MLSDVPKIKIFIIVLAIFIYQIVNQTKSTLFLWFARTLIHCPNTDTVTTRNGSSVVVSTPKHINNDKAWSGSSYCSDHDYVAGWAQYIVTFSITTNTLCALVFVPMLGSLSDRYGRRFLLVLSQIGYFVCLICIGFAAVLNRHSDDQFTIVLVVIGSSVNGATSVFGLGVTSMIIDMQMKESMVKTRALSEALNAGELAKDEESRLNKEAEDGIGKFVGIFQGLKAFGTAVGASAGLYYTTKNLESYASLWFWLAVPIFVNTILINFAPETLLKTGRRTSLLEDENLTPVVIGQGEDVLLNNSDYSCDDDNQPQNIRSRRSSLCQCAGKEGGACAAWPLICGNATILTIAFFLFFFIIGTSCIAIAQVFMTTQFGWTSTTTTLAGMSSGIIGVVSLLSAGKIIKFLGSLRALVTAACLATIGLGFMATAPIGWVFFMIGLYVLLSSTFGTVAYVQFIAARVSPSTMGAIQGGLTTFAMLGFIIGINMFTALNIALPKEYRWLCFLLGSFIAGIGCALIFSLVLSRKAPSSEVTEMPSLDKRNREVTSNKNIEY